MVQDLPEVETAFDALVPDSLKSRVSFQPHNLMEPQPQQDAKVLLIRYVLHDFPDEIAVQILRNLINGKDGLMKAGTRIIVADHIMPPKGAIPTPLERLITTSDLQVSPPSVQKLLHPYRSC